jgi:hypothetical protein
MSDDYFKDESIFDGVYEFNSPCGELQFINNGKTSRGIIFEVYKKEDRTFIFWGKLLIKGKITCKKLYEEYWNAELIAERHEYEANGR